MNMIDWLLQNDDPCIAYRARALLRGEDPAAVEMRALRERMRTSENARRLLGQRAADGTIRANPYQKWQGAHWTLYSLMLLGYPPGDGLVTPAGAAGLAPLRDQMYAYLFAPEHLKPQRSLFIPGQADRPRRCASQEGNAILYSLALGLEDSRTHELVDRLVAYQWPDGGWNCDKRPEAHTSSFVETLIPLRALWHYGSTRGHAAALAAAQSAAEFLLQRRLLYRLSDGALVRPAWGGALTRIHYPIQFYDLLFALQVMAEMGKIDDPRCAPALGMLAAKQLPDGGFPLEEKNARFSAQICTRGSFVDWGPAGARQSNPWVTVDALWVLKQAGVAV
jgi:hypothetical protein